MINTFISEPSLPVERIERLHLFEYALYAIILVIALGIPFFTGAFTNNGWERVLKDWMRLCPFVLIFAANNYLWVPKLFFREKYLHYMLTCILSVTVVVCLSMLLFDFTRPGPPHLEGMKGMVPSPPFGKSKPPDGFAPGKNMHLFFHFGSAIIAVLLIGFNTGIKSFVQWSEEKVRQAEKDRHHFYTELALLKQQISPHFFMNTLNNIHALVDINAQKAKNAIIRLSSLMRYLLYESDEQKVLLQKEVDFIESYIELMRLRYDEENLTIETEYPDRMETVAVPSSLFLSFIENAFKHGVNPSLHALIKISFSVENDRLTFRIINDRSHVTTQQTETTGIGLENVRKRLDLIYREHYTLDIRSSGNRYEVILKIPVS